jgi:NADH dehydrogenase
VVVIGAGFGGLSAVRGLRNAPCEIILVDRRNHHLFQPLLYQVATAALSPADVAAPIRSIVRRQRNVQVILGEATDLDLDAREVEVGSERIRYDWLVLAAGANHAYFGNRQWEERAPGLKTVEDALEIRRRALLAFEEAELEDDPAGREAKLTFVIVGGGPTGVEMAGALREIAAQTIPRDFRRVDTTTTRIILIEGQGRLLPAMSREAGAYALKALEAMGVEVRLNTVVTDMDEEHVHVGEDRVLAANVIWAAGVEGETVARTLGVELDQRGRVVVESDCSIPGHPEAFVIGDLAAQVDAKTGRPVPGVAQGAMQMGRFVAGVIRDSIQQGRPLPVRRPFSYGDKGDLATIGRARAVADIRNRTFTGFAAWLFWSLVHVFFLIGFRNKLLVMINWAWQWIVQARGARLITGFPEVRVKKRVDL